VTAGDCVQLALCFVAVSALTLVYLPWTLDIVGRIELTIECWIGRRRRRRERVRAMPRAYVTPRLHDGAMWKRSLRFAGAVVLGLIVIRWMFSDPWR